MILWESSMKVGSVVYVLSQKDHRRCYRSSHGGDTPFRAPEPLQFVTLQGTPHQFHVSETPNNNNPFRSNGISPNPTFQHITIPFLAKEYYLPSIMSIFSDVYCLYSCCMKGPGWILQYLFASYDHENRFTGLILPKRRIHIVEQRNINIIERWCVWWWYVLVDAIHMGGCWNVGVREV